MPKPKIQSITLADGTKAFGVEVDFEAARETSNSYTLADGTELRVRTLLTRVMKVVDTLGNPRTDESGNPIYYVNTGIEITVDDEPEKSDILREQAPDGSERWYTVHPKTGVRVEIDPQQAWFWTKEWQVRERQADEDLAQGRFEVFDDFDSFIDSL
jgi:hypothetical protein